MIVHITPALPPAISGVGDYSALLARGLQESYGLESRFFLGRSAADRSGLEKLLESGVRTVLLQYSGYGYAAKGCPEWLVSALENWKQLPERRLVTMFHELYASGKPWQSSFWLQPLQKALVRRLSAISDEVLTSRGANERELKSWLNSHAPRITVLPIFSNVGEPQKWLPWDRRKKTLVVFGTAGRREMVYQNGTPLIEAVCRTLSVESIFDIGPNCKHVPAALAGVPVERLGELAPDAIDRLLGEAMFAIIDYPVEILSKSGIFAAYSAHGLATFVTGSLNRQTDDRLQAGAHFYLEELPENLAAAEAVAKAAFDWYQAHSLQAHIKWFGEALQGKGE